MKRPYYYDQIQDYAVDMFNRNLKVFSQNTFKPLDFVSEAFTLGYEDLEDAKKIIRNHIIDEK